MSARNETIAELRRHKAQAWASRNGKTTNRATRSWVAGTLAAPVRVSHPRSVSEMYPLEFDTRLAYRLQQHTNAWANR